MNDLISESVIRLAEKLQLPERLVHIEHLPWVPFNDEETCFFKPLRFDLSTGTWIYLFRVESNQVLGRHRHTGGSVIGYTLQGRWRYAERDWTAVPGTFIFEPPGDIHTLISEDEEVVALFILSGTLQYFDENNQFGGQDDIYTVIQKYHDYCTRNHIPVNDELIY
ncbi:2,4'-dihydroxyacetophenone dioxygenase family protein [Paenibacillus kobensis]|uniref:2,4'-dihydroxyacetophenone dioxygenase family protein n=1 Tax=Paenibacillus kobensis TaxID=59841 RepID=UPI000FDAB848|nr:2,4'-dihydroxyacetophenone dioxygenase family protein [Paenibacillus kobensis]